MVDSKDERLRVELKTPTEEERAHLDRLEREAIAGGERGPTIREAMDLLRKRQAEREA